MKGRRQNDDFTVRVVSRGHLGREKIEISSREDNETKKLSFHRYSCPHIMSFKYET